MDKPLPALCRRFYPWMEFYFALNGILYLLPGLFVYALAWWKRPLVAVVISLFMMRAVAQVLDGQPVTIWAMPMLGLVTAFAWNRGEWKWNAALFLIGMALCFYTLRTEGWLYIDRPGMGEVRSTAIGICIVAVRALFFWAKAAFGSLVKKSPTTPDGT